MQQPVNSVKKPILIAIGLFIVDAIVLNQGAIAAVTALIIVFWMLPKSVYLKYKNQSPRSTLIKCAIYGTMAIAVFWANSFHNSIARSQAEDLIVVIEKYHEATGVYPEKLEDLVPTYVSSVPIAKPTFSSGKFGYINHEGNVTLFYVDVPPFGRPTYHFNSKSWGYMD